MMNPDAQLESSLAETKLLHLASKLPDYEKATMKEMILGRNDKLFKAVNEYENSQDEEQFRDDVLFAVIEESVDRAYSIWNQVFAEMPTEYGKMLAKAARDRNPEFSRQSLVYGEIEFFSFASILEQAKPQENELFVDLGHGTGRAVLAAALLYGHKLKQCKGIEILDDLCEVSIKAHKILSTGAKNATYATQISLIHGDILLEDWSDADIIFVNSTCFDAGLMKQLAIKATLLKTGARIMTLTKPIDADELTIVEKKQYAMSWGYATCFFHVRQ